MFTMTYFNQWRYVNRKEKGVDFTLIVVQAQEYFEHNQRATVHLLIFALLGFGVVFAWKVAEENK